MARPFPIGDQSEGINLLRYKGGASPRALFDLVNGYVTAKRTIKARPGAGASVGNTASTVGGVGFENKIHVFASSPVTLADPLFVVNILKHPTGGAAALTTIHKAMPIYGRLYVVAEFADGVVQHYWCQNEADWAANTLYAVGQRVRPTVKSGYAHEVQAQTGTAWSAGATVANGDFLFPTTDNGFKYQASGVTGKTGATEPVWPTTEGGTVTEYENG